MRAAGKGMVLDIIVVRKGNENFDSNNKEIGSRPKIESWYSLHRLSFPHHCASVPPFATPTASLSSTVPIFSAVEAIQKPHVHVHSAQQPSESTLRPPPTPSQLSDQAAGSWYRSP